MIDILYVIYIGILVLGIIFGNAIPKLKNGKLSLTQKIYTILLPLLGLVYLFYRIVEIVNAK